MFGKVSKTSQLVSLQELTMSLSLLQYFCFECKLFDDEEKEQFHCDGCGICRIGGRDNFFHCPTCNMCLPAHLKGKHRVRENDDVDRDNNVNVVCLQCIENLSRSNCPICLEDIHTSREPSQIPPCNHLIHKSCFDALIQAGHFFCPVCARSLVNMAVMWGLYDQQIRETPLPKPYQVQSLLKFTNVFIHYSKYVDSL